MGAGLDYALTISGRSTRIGTAADLMNAGKTTAQIQLAGGWRSAEMVVLRAPHRRSPSADLRLTPTVHR